MSRRSGVVAAVVAAFLLVVGAREAQAAPQEVKIGVYLKNVESIDLQNNTYYLNFVLWMRWKGEIDPTRSFRFQNLIDTSSLSQVAVYEAPKELEDGSKYQRFAVEGRFFHKFWLGTFPIDWQKITLEIEDAEHPASVLAYLADETDSKLHPDLQIPGWRISEVVSRARNETHPTSFGLGTQDEGARTFSHYRFGLRIDRPSSFLLLKVVPPIALVLLCCLMMFFLKPDYVDARVGTVITALLTEVFLHLTFTSALPSVGLLMLLDHIFNLSYFLTVIMLLECVVVTRFFDRMTSVKEELEGIEDAEEKRRSWDEILALRARIKRLDRIATISFPVAYVVGCTIVVVLVRGPGDLMRML